MAWHPRRALLATGSTFDSTRLDNATIWTPDGTLHAHMAGTNELWKLGWSCDGRILGSVADTITLWTADGKGLRQLPGEWMAWNPTSYHLVSYTHIDRQCWLWNIVAGTQHRLDAPLDPRFWRYPLVWSPLGTYLLGAWNAQDTTIQLMLWDRDGQEIGRYTVDPSVAGPVMGCVWHPDEAGFVILTEQQMVLLDRQGTVLHIFPIAVNRLSGWNDSTPCQWSPDGSVLAAATGATIQLWSKTGRPIATLPVLSDAITVVWTPDSAILTTSSWSDQLCLWTRTGQKLMDVSLSNPELGPRPMRMPYTLLWDKQGRYLAASLRSRTVHIWTWENTRDGDLE
jgi:WD40 repeat protein